MIKQVGRSVSAFSKINIWECDSCREQWTTPTGMARCPYCHRAGAVDPVKSWVPSFLPWTDLRPSTWSTKLTLLVAASASGGALYLWSRANPSGTTLRQKFAPWRTQNLLRLGAVLLK